ncbi:MAG: iron-containing alcohol dehydrogenase [Deltaproteobacteria bacterium]
MSTTEMTFDFVAPSRIVFGWGRRREAGGLARSLGRRAFIVCGSRTLELSGVIHEIIESLRDAGVESIRTEMISREPLVEDVDRSVASLRKHRAGAGDLLLAIGGGSAIDLAKAAGALVTQDSMVSVLDYLEGVGKGLKIVNAPLPVLAMPTTGGTGSEATKNAVISSYDPPFKKSLRSELMVPRVVLVDPELSVSVPPHITAWTGMDAITQLVESLISRRATAATRHVAWCGLMFAVPNVAEAYRNGNSRTAREAMAQAAFLSGVALANSGLGMAHGIAAALGVHCCVPHGLACAVMLPVALRVNASIDAVNSKLAEAALAILGAMAMHPLLSGEQAMPEQAHVETGRKIGAQAAIARVEALCDDLKIPHRLSEIGVKREQIPAIVRDSRGNSMSGNPRDLSDEELTRILEEML